MDSFSTKRRKLNFVYQKNQENSKNIDRQDKIDKEIVYQVEQNKSSNQFFHKLRDFSIDWAVCDNIGNLTEQYISWDIEWDLFDIRLLPYLDIKPMYRVVGGTIANPESITPYQNKIFQLTDIASESSIYYKKVLLNFSMRLRSVSNLYTTYESRLNVLFINPRQYR